MPTKIGVILYVVKEHYDDAIRDFTAAIRLNPDNPGFTGSGGKRM